MEGLRPYRCHFQRQRGMYELPTCSSGFEYPRRYQTSRQKQSKRCGRRLTRPFSSVWKKYGLIILVLDNVLYIFTVIRRTSYLDACCAFQPTHPRRCSGMRKVRPIPSSIPRSDSIRPARSTCSHWFPTYSKTDPGGIPRSSWVMIHGRILKLVCGSPSHDLYPLHSSRLFSYQRVYFRNINHPIARPSVVGRRQEARNEASIRNDLNDDERRCAPIKFPLKVLY